MACRPNIMRCGSFLVGVLPLLMACGGGAPTSSPGVITHSPSPQVPVISTQPRSQTVNPGQPVVFSVVASGGGTLQYQWRKGGVDIPGADTADFLLRAAADTDAGDYAVVVTNPVGSVASTPATLSLNVAPTVLTAPVNRQVSMGAPCHFSVVATGTAPLSYQWRHDGVAIPGATGAQWALSSVAMADAGRYDVVVSNVAGKVQSAEATLAVDAAPVIVGQPVSQDVGVGQPAVFSVSVQGQPPFAYQWLRNGADVAGQTGATLSLPAVALADAGAYAVRISNAAGTVLSAPALLKVSVLADFSVKAAYITQSTQTTSFGVPLVQGRDGLLRVFVVSDVVGAEVPGVRARFFQGSELVATLPLTHTRGDVPVGTAIESDLGASWNAVIPGAMIRHGLQLMIEVDPEQKTMDPVRGNNTWPGGATAFALDVRTLKPFGVTLLAVCTKDGRVGGVDNTSAAAYVDLLDAMWPIPGSSSVEFGGVFTSSVSTLAADGDGWDTVLYELDAKRIADGSRRNYYGVVNPAYAGGVAGLGFIGGLTAMGWDRTSGYPDQGLRNGIFAHEIGHNFGLLHAPCGGASGVDSQFPQMDGGIASWGTDVQHGVLKNPAYYRDVMGYCDGLWVSDYNYRKVIDGRLAIGEARAALDSAIPAGQGEARSLLLWGSLENGEATLAPVFHMAVDAQAPEGGDHHLEGFDAMGRRLFQVPFGLKRLGCDDRHRQAFAFSIPWTAEQAQALVELRWSKAGEVLARHRDFQGGRVAEGRVLSREPELQALATGRTRLLWDEATQPLAMVRDPRTGKVIAFGRGGELRLPTGRRDLEVHFSTGLGSRVWRAAQE